MNQENLTLEQLIFALMHFHSEQDDDIETNVTGLFLETHVGHEEDSKLVVELEEEVE